MIMDMEAGLEHLGRGTTQGMDQFVVVIEPGARSVQTYKNVKRLAAGPGREAGSAWLPTRYEDRRMRRSSGKGSRRKICWASCIYNAEVIDADRQGKSPYDFSPEAVEEIKIIKARMDSV